MAPAEPIPVVRVAGTHRAVGELIGEVCRETIRRAAAFDTARIPEGRTRDEQLALADRYRDVTFAAYPWYHDEITGAADAAEVDVRALFACAIEEIWYVPYARRTEGRCTDLVTVPPATRDDHVLVAHNNDMSRAYQDELVALVYEIDGEPTVFAIGNGIWISCGWNDAGVSFTGNELSPLDERIGIPREVQFRAMLRRPSLAAARDEALRPDRASNYNHVLVARSGAVENVEGSATDAEITTVDVRGHLVHTNHYVCDRMLRYEGDRAYAEHSAIRYRRAAELLASRSAGTITTDDLRTFLSDHANEPDSLCRHPERWPATRSGTTFWWIADLTEMVLRFGRGNPCDAIEQTFSFETAEARSA